MVAAPVPAAGFPPHANGAWVYDPRAGHGADTVVSNGHFAAALARYNHEAEPGARIGEYYIYGGDMEMYCPEHDTKRCSADDFHVYYSETAQHPHSQPRASPKNAAVRAYADALRKPASTVAGKTPLLVPIIDGVISGHGALRGFNELTQNQAFAFADKVARQVCADGNVAGIQFDLEPFNVDTRNGQYYFYRRIAQDFASAATGCVDSTHPKGRFFSIFTTANRIRPGSKGARNVRDIMAPGNGYLIDALYDLLGTPVGHQTPPGKYRAVVGRETRHMRAWAGTIGVKYQFGIPAAAGAHEFAHCVGSRCPATTARTGERPPPAGTTQLDYVKAAVEAIRHSGAPDDPLYLGVALWAWGEGVHYRDMRLLPAVPTNAVLQFLCRNLPGAG